MEILSLPSKEKPLADVISVAISTGSFDMKIKPKGDLKQFIVKIEINHFTDFNGNSPKSAKGRGAGYSGDKEGCGQPAVVYAANVGAGR